jgi:hypothetical protein
MADAESSNTTPSPELVLLTSPPVSVVPNRLPEESRKNQGGCTATGAIGEKKQRVEVPAAASIRREFKCGALNAGLSEGSNAVEISRAVDCQCGGQRSVAGVGKIVDVGKSRSSRARNLEDRAAASVAIVAASLESESEQISGRVENGGDWVFSACAAAETVENGFSPGSAGGRGQVEGDATTFGAAWRSTPCRIRLYCSSASSRPRDLESQFNT